MYEGSLMSGLLVVISAPSGAGKTSIIDGILEKNKHDYQYSVSATSRPPRKGEINGIDYYFITEEEFKRKIENNEFIEWAQVHNYYYGTLREKVETLLAKHHVIILDLDVCGGRSIREKYPQTSLLIFIAPPSRKVLLERLRTRGTDSEVEIQKRLTRYPEEMGQAQFYDHIIVNEVLNDTIDVIEKLIVEANKKNKV